MKSVANGAPKKVIVRVEFDSRDALTRFSTTHTFCRRCKTMGQTISETVQRAIISLVYDIQKDGWQ